MAFEVLAEINFSGGIATRYVATKPIISPNHAYLGEIVSISGLERSTGIKPGDLRLVQFQLELYNGDLNDRYYTFAKSVGAFIGLTVSVYIIDTSKTFIQRQKIAEGFIYDYGFNQTSIVLVISDKISGKIDETIPWRGSLSNTGIANNVGVNIPIVYGKILKNAADPFAPLDVGTHRNNVNEAVYLSVERCIVASVYEDQTVKSVTFVSSKPATKPADFQYYFEQINGVWYTLLTGPWVEQKDYTWECDGPHSSSGIGDSIVDKYAKVLNQSGFTINQESFDKTKVDLALASVPVTSEDCGIYLTLNSDTIRSLIRHMGESCGIDTFIHSDGSIGIASTFPRNETGAIEITEQDIVYRSFNIRSTGEIVNELKYEFYSCFAGGGAFIPRRERIARAQTQISAIGIRGSQNVQMHFTQSLDLAMKVAENVLFYGFENRVIASFDMDISKSITLNPGDSIRLTHPYGLTPVGFYKSQFRIITVGKSVREGITYSNVAAISAENIAPKKPFEPESFGANPTLDSVILSWEQVLNDADTFDIEYKRSSSNTWSNTISLSGSSRETTIDDLITGKSYDFRIRAVNAVGESDWILLENIVPKSEQISTIPYLIASHGLYTVNLLWATPSGTIEKFILEYKIIGVDSDFGNAIELTPNSTEFSLFIFQLDVQFIARIRSVTSGGNSIWTYSNVIQLSELSDFSEPYFSPLSSIGTIIGALNIPINPVIGPIATARDIPVTYSLENAPNWMQFNLNTREISGTPDALLQPTLVTYVATDIDGDKDTIVFTVRVRAVELVPTFGTATINDLDDLIFETAINPVTLPQATSGDIPLNYSLLNAPNWMQLEGNELSGIPDIVQQTLTEITYRVTDHNGDFAELMFDYRVYPSVPTVPRNARLEIGNAQFRIRWERPENTGGVSDIAYRIEYREGNNAWQLATQITDGSTHYDLTGLTNGDIYSVRIRAYNTKNGTVQNSPWSGTLTGIPSTVGIAPGIPANVDLNVADSELDLEWVPPTNDGGNPVTYEIQYKETSSANWSNTIEEGGTSFTIDSLINGRSYDVRIRAKNISGVSTWINNTAIPAGLANAPTGLSGAPGDDDIDLIWVPPTNNNGRAITTYEVEYKLVSETDWNSETTTDDTTELNITGLIAGARYQFRVRANTSIGAGAWSIIYEKSIRTVPGDVQSLSSAYNDGEIYVDLEWIAPIDDGSGLTGYKLQMQVDGAGNWDNLPNASASSLSRRVTFDLQDLPKTIQFRIKAFNENGDGLNWTLSNVITATSVPNGARSFMAIAGNEQGTLSWQEPAFNGGFPILGCQIQRRILPNDFEDLATVNQVSTSYIDQNLMNLSTYEYRIRCRNQLGYGPWVVSNSIIPISNNQVPTLVRNLQGIPLDGAIKFFWNVPEVGAPILGYIGEYQKIGGSEDWQMAFNSLITEWELSSILNDDSYNFRIKAYNSFGNGEVREIGPISAYSPGNVIPTSVQDLAANPTNARVDLDWNEPNNVGGNEVSILGYLVEYRKESDTDWISAGEIIDTEISIDSLENDNSYIFRVSARNILGYGPITTVTATPMLPDPPEKPDNISDSPANRSVLISWDNPSGEIDQIVVQYKANSESDWQPEIELSANTTQYNFTGLDNGTLYNFRVRADNEGGKGAYGTVNSTPRTLPPDLTNLEYIAGETNINTEWTIPQNLSGAPLTGIEIQYKEIEPMPTEFGNSEILAADATTHNITGLTTGGVYQVRVRSINAAGNSEWLTSGEIALEDISISKYRRYWPDFYGPDAATYGDIGPYYVS